MIHGVLQGYRVHLVYTKRNNLMFPCYFAIAVWSRHTGVGITMTTQVYLRIDNFPQGCFQIFLINWMELRSSLQLF